MKDFSYWLIDPTSLDWRLDRCLILCLFSFPIQKQVKRSRGESPYEKTFTRREFKLMSWRSSKKGKKIDGIDSISSLFCKPRASPPFFFFISFQMFQSNLFPSSLVFNMNKWHPLLPSAGTQNSSTLLIFMLFSFKHLSTHKLKLHFKLSFNFQHSQTKHSPKLPVGIHIKPEAILPHGYFDESVHDAMQGCVFGCMEPMYVITSSLQWWA
jgi:hypothetical protein